jgi:hypothetical protein
MEGGVLAGHKDGWKVAGEGESAFRGILKIDFNREAHEEREERKGIKSYFLMNDEMNDFCSILFFAFFAVNFRTSF